MTEENSSSPETERQVVMAHGYGQQLGRLLDAVNELIAERPAGSPELPSIEDFKQLWCDVEKIKAESAVKRIERAITELAEMKRLRAGEYQRLAAQWRASWKTRS